LLLSVDTYPFLERFPVETALHMIKEAGFDAFDFTLCDAPPERDLLEGDYRTRAAQVRRIADGIGIPCNQAHAPYDFTFEDTLELSNRNYLRLVRSIEVASILGAKNLIIHAVKNNCPPHVDLFGFNTAFYKSFLPYCEQFGVHISVENLYIHHANDTYTAALGSPREHIEFVRGLGSDWFNICVDTGHASLTGYEPEDMISAMDADILQALHIHDNDYLSDQHLFPYAGGMNWDAITAALGKIGYRGDFTFEILGYLRKADDALLAPALEFAEKIGRCMMEKIQKEKRI